MLKVSGIKPQETPAQEMPIALEENQATYIQESSQTDIVEKTQYNEAPEMQMTSDMLSEQVQQAEAVELIKIPEPLTNSDLLLYETKQTVEKAIEETILVAEATLTTEISTKQSTTTHKQQPSDKHTDTELVEDATATQEAKVTPELQPEPFRELDAGEMEQIRGRLLPVVIVAAIKAAPVVTKAIVGIQAARKAAPVVVRATHHSHHIVAKAAHGADRARNHLQRMGFDVNNALVNRVTLPAEVHARMHTKVYYRAVNRRILDTRSVQGANNALRGIARAIQSGRFPR
ncbi:MAG: hypothetical protein DDT29_02564 [Dehalococcoidia bacterium]|nr:hypothetical protein [Bacillota bacterium]